MVVDDFAGILDTPPGEAQAGSEDILTGQQAAPGEAQGHTSDFHKYVDDLFRKGFSEPEIREVMQLRALDPSKMDDKQAIIAGLKREYPGVDNETLEGLYESDYGDDTDPKIKAARFKKAVESRNQIQELISKSAEPQASLQARKAQEQQQVAQTQWAGVSDRLVKKQLAELPITMDTQDGKGYSFGYKLSEETQTAVAQAGAAYAVQQGLQMKEDSLPAVKEYMTRLAWFMEGDKIAKAMARDMIAKSVRLAAHQSVNPASLVPGAQAAGGEQHADPMAKARAKAWED